MDFPGNLKSFTCGSFSPAISARLPPLRASGSTPPYCHAEREGLNLEFPEVDKTRRKALEAARDTLEKK